MKKAILFARVSGDDGAKENRKLKSQLDMCRKYAQSHNYSNVAELAEDERGASGASFDFLLGESGIWQQMVNTRSW